MLGLVQVRFGLVASIILFLMFFGNFFGTYQVQKNVEVPLIKPYQIPLKVRPANHQNISNPEETIYAKLFSVDQS